MSSSIIEVIIRPFADIPQTLKLMGESLTKLGLSYSSPVRIGLKKSRVYTFTVIGTNEQIAQAAIELDGVVFANLTIDEVSSAWANGSDESNSLWAEGSDESNPLWED